MVKFKSKILLFGATVIVAFSFAPKAHAETDNRPVYDLSEWQGTISQSQAEALKGEAKGVILRVQYGANYHDKVFDNNATVLKANGIKFGVYAYGRYVNSSDAKDEAKTFYNRAKQYNPVFYVNDAEEHTTYSGQSYADATKAFAQQLRSLTSTPVYLYSYQSFYKNYIGSQSGYQGMWLAAYQSVQPSTSFSYQLWQNEDNHYSTALSKAIDSSKFVNNANWFGHTVSPSNYPYGGYSVGDTVKIKAGTSFYDTKLAVDPSLIGKTLTVKQTKLAYTGKSSQILTIYNGSQVLGQVRAQDVTKVSSAKPTASSSNWVSDSETYTLTTPVNLRSGTSTSSSAITTLAAGSTIKTDRAIIQGGYRWVRQPRSNGYAYMATGPASDSLAYVKTGVAHTYYTVVSGDSWWVIAQRNGLSMTKLASQNGKSIKFVIHPGDTLLIK